jgi:hypothetical protein
VMGRRRRARLLVAVETRLGKKRVAIAIANEYTSLVVY